MPVIVPMQVTASNQELPMDVTQNQESVPSDIDLRIGYKGEKGDDGVGIASCVLNPDYTLTITLTDGTSYTTESIRGAQGEQGPAGQDGQQGPEGPAGKDGKDGDPGPAGADGKDGQDGQPGRDGSNGQDGEDGFSPIATVTKSGKVATITITDKNGTTTQTVSDGNDGQNGQDGQDGAAGQDGKTAYQYAVDGGYTGTEQQFAQKMAQEIPPTMSVLSYGHSTWADFLAAYSTNSVVYCRASSGNNPASGSQTRMAFMAYVDKADASEITNVEFQYYRSVNTHSNTQQGDQVYIYKLHKTSGWSVTVRENYTKIVAGTGLSGSYSNGVLTISLA